MPLAFEFEVLFNKIIQQYNFYILHKEIKVLKEIINIFQYWFSNEVGKEPILLHDSQSACLKIVRHKLARKFSVALKLTDML